MSTSLLTLDSLIINGMDAARSYADVKDALLTLAMTETITGASSATMTLSDPHRTILRSTLLSAGSDATTDALGAEKAGRTGLAGATMVLSGVGMELKAIRKSGSVLTLTWEPMAIAQLRRKTGQRVAAAGAMTRAEFCASLIREVAWIKVAYAPGAKSLEQLARGSTTTATDTTVATDNAWGGITALGTGTNIASGESILSDGERHTVGTATTASDNQITGDGERHAAASAPTTAAVTAAAVAASTALARTAAVKKNLEDTWTACGRIMGEIDWRCFERRGGLILAPDAWLLAHAPASYTLAESSTGVDFIDLDWNVGKPAATATLQVWAGSADLVPGSALTLTGMGPGNGTWLVETINRTLGSKVATVTAVRPLPALAEPADASANGSGVGGEAGFGGYVQLGTDIGSRRFAGGPSENAGPGASLGERFVQVALAQRGKRYVGGGHGPSTFDCSGLVQYAAAAVGVRFPAPVSEQTAAMQAAGKLITVQTAIATRGAVLWRGTPGVNGGMSGSDHIAISLGNGTTIEARGRAYGVNVFSATKGRDWAGGGVIPDLGPA